MEEEHNLTSLWLSKDDVINHWSIQELWYTIHDLKKEKLEILVLLKTKKAQFLFNWDWKLCCCAHSQLMHPMCSTKLFSINQVTGW